MTDYEKLKNVFDELGIDYISWVYGNSKDIFLTSSQESKHFEFDLESEEFIKITHY